ncbi:MAG TPA: site-2 protease family protein [Leptolyngbyaceae cyanobacterium]
MNFFLLLLLLGLATYFIVKLTVVGITRTSVWLLWLVMMIPPLVWTAWILVYGRNQPMPLILMIGIFGITLFLYSWLIQRGRVEVKPPEGQTSEPSASPEIGSQNNHSAKVRPLNKAEESSLRECFPWGVYYLQNLEFRPQAVICRGHLRSKPEVAYKTIRENIEAKFGDRFLIIFQDGFNGNPFFALVPNPQAQSNDRRYSEPLTRPLLALGLLVATLYTTTIIGAKLAGVSSLPIFKPDPVGLPYSLALITILGVREMVRYLVARRYKLRVSLPYFIPFPDFLGTLGAFSQVRSLAPNRKALFDVAIAGPLAGLVVTIPLLIWGLANSKIVPIPEKSWVLNFEALNPSFSLLLTLLSKLALGSQFTANSAISLHPVAIAGYIGLIITALTLMPVGQLDGGRIVHAIFGQRQAATIGQVARFLLLAVSLMPWITGVTLIPPAFLFWAIFLFLIPIYNEPALNDVTELNDRRDLLGLMALGLLLLIILPVPRSIAQLFT